MHELTRLANNYGTDKGSEHKDYIHCYTEFYGPLLNHRRNDLKNVGSSNFHEEAYSRR